MTIVDWEYAGMGDRFFDLGQPRVNNGLAEDDDERLLAAYFGRAPTEAEAASLWLMRLMSDLREATWGLLQGVLSPLDFDYGAYAGEHFARMARGRPRPAPGGLAACRGRVSCPPARAS